MTSTGTRSAATSRRTKTTIPSHEYVRQNRPHGGIIILPQRGTFERLELRAAMMLDWIASESASYQSRLFLWNDLQLQLTHGLQLAGYTASQIKEVLGQSP